MKLIEKENLIKDKSYYIECFKYDFNMNLVRDDFEGKCVATFHNYSHYQGMSVEKHSFAFFYNYRRIRDNINYGYGRSLNLNLHWKFYEIEKEQIQSAMESRAYNAILQKKIGDKYFYY